MLYIFILFLIGISWYCITIYQDNKRIKLRQNRMMQIEQQMSEPGAPSEKIVTAKCFHEIDELLKHPLTISLNHRLDYLKTGGMNKKDAYDYIINQGWTPKKYVFTLLMQMMCSDARTICPGAGSKTNRDIYDYLNTTLYKENMITYNEMESNSFEFMKAIVKKR